MKIIDDFYINYNISFLTSRYLATGDAITTIAYNFQMGVSTARQIILDVCKAIWDVLAPIYMPVPSEDKWKSIADEFYERWNFSNCIGAINGKHVMIQSPVNPGSLFYNYKSYFSIVLLAVASADYRFVTFYYLYIAFHILKGSKCATTSIYTIIVALHRNLLRLRLMLCQTYIGLWWTIHTVVHCLPQLQLCVLLSLRVFDFP